MVAIHRFLVKLIFLLLLIGHAPAPAHAQGRSLLPLDDHVLALLDFNENGEDSSPNRRNATVVGGTFVETPYGKGLQVGTESDTGVDWSAYAPLLQFPYTIEMIVRPEETLEWRKLFSFDDLLDEGWYYKSDGIQSYPHAVLGIEQVLAQEWAYVAFVATAPNEIEIYLNGESLGRTNAGFTAPPPQAIFFRDDLSTNRAEQLTGIIEVVRISDSARSPEEIMLGQHRVAQDSNQPILETIPLPQEVEFTPEVVGTNIGLAMFLAAGFGLVSTIFNSTVKENGEQLQATLREWVEPFRRRLPQGLHLPAVPESWKQTRGFTFLLFLLSALIYSFLDPTFRFNLDGLFLFLSLFLALILVSVTYDMVQGQLAHRYFARAGQLQAFPGALAIALVCVLLSRLFGFQPGYLMGFAAAYVLVSNPIGEPQTVVRQNALLILAGASLLLITALLAWLLTGVVVGIPLIHATFALLFVAGLEGVLFVLVPLDFMDGRMVFRWSKVAWFVAFVVAFYWYCQILLNPSSSYLGAFEESNVRFALLTLAVYASITAGLWFYFRRRTTVLPSVPPPTLQE